MLSLQTISHSSRQSFFQIKNTRSAHTLSQKSKNHLLWVFKTHIDTNIVKKNSATDQDIGDKSAQIAVEIFHTAWQKHSFEKTQLEVKKTIAESVSKSMKNITRRKPGSKTGVMYEDEYYKVILNGQDDYLMHDLTARNGKQIREYPCFTSGGTVCNLIKKDDVTASVAIHSFFEGPTSADCGSTVEAVFFKAICDVLGEKKFNKIWNSRKLEINQWVSCSGNSSSLVPFLEYANPNITAQANEKKLEIGDHLMVTGVPWYLIKHPNGNMSNSHAVIVDFNKNKEPLIQGLGLLNGQSLSLPQIKRSLVEFSNNIQSREDREYIEKFYSSVYPTPEVIQKHRKRHPHFKPFDKINIFKATNVKEAKAFGGCVISNSDVTRLSSYVLAVLKDAPDNADLDQYLMIAKAEVVARQLFDGPDDFLNLLKNRKL